MKPHDTKNCFEIFLGRQCHNEKFRLLLRTIGPDPNPLPPE